MFRSIYLPRDILFIILLLSFLTPAKALEIKVSDSRENNFYMDALTWVLNKSGVQYQLVHTTHPISTQSRKVALVLRGEIDVIYAGTTKQLESSLEPIRIPITRGLIGSRLLVINKRYQKTFNKILDLNDNRHTWYSLKSQLLISFKLSHNPPRSTQWETSISN